MKAIEINKEIVTFNVLPDFWNDENGTHFNIGDGKHLGFKDLISPDYDGRIEELSNLHLSGKFYTYDVIDKEITESLEELKEQKIKSLNQSIGKELNKSDWYLIRELDTKEIIPEDVVNYRLELRELSNTIQTEIDDLQTKKEVLIFDLPKFDII